MKLTKTELDLILVMEGIATAGNGDGDYEPWGESDWAALKSLGDKVLVELGRREATSKRRTEHTKQY